MRSIDPASARPPADGAARAARAVVEQLEMLWERGREAVPTAPVSTSQLRVLYILDQQDGINLRTLGEQLGAAPSSVSRLCDRLEALGYLGRSFPASDRRQVTLRLTPPGHTYLAELRAHREEGLAATLAAMTAAERDALTVGLDAFRRAIGTTVRHAPETEDDRRLETAEDMTERPPDAPGGHDPTAAGTRSARSA